MFLVLATKADDFGGEETPALPAALGNLVANYGDISESENDDESKITKPTEGRYLTET